MKLASFLIDTANHIGVLTNDDRIAVITSIPAMTDFIRLGEAAQQHVISALADGPFVSCADVRWQPPVRNPGKVCGVAMNNSASNARKISAPDHPAYFLKPSSCLIGHEQPIRIRPYYGSVHPEPELAVIIGRQTKDIDAIDALSSVFGYSIFNDVTGNGMRADDLFHYWALYSGEEDGDELIRREQHLSYAARYKGSDTFGCLGPFITTIDEIEDPDNLEVSCKVGGETIAEDSTRYYNYKVAELISYLSQFMTLEPGDIICCGTAFKPASGRRSIHHANLQKVAGPVEVVISGLGVLSNTVIIEDKAMRPWRLN